MIGNALKQNLTYSGQKMKIHNYIIMIMYINIII